MNQKTGNVKVYSNYLGGNGKPFNFGALQHFPGGGARMETKAGGEKETRGGGGRVQIAWNQPDLELGSLHLHIPKEIPQVQVSSLNSL